jgi:hypothetical protein
MEPKDQLLCIEEPSLDHTQSWLNPIHIIYYKEYLYCVDRAHGSALCGGRCSAWHEAHANFADESACLTAYNVRNEVVTIHGSQELLKMLSPLHVDIFSQLIVYLKNTGTTFLLALTAHQTPTFTGWLQQLCCRSCTRLWHSSLLSYTFQWFSRRMFKFGPYVIQLLSKHSVLMFLFLIC